MSSSRLPFPQKVGPNMGHSVIFSKIGDLQIRTIKSAFAKVKCNNWLEKDVWDDQQNLRQDF